MNFKNTVDPRIRSCACEFYLGGSRGRMHSGLTPPEISFTSQGNEIEGGIDRAKVCCPTTFDAVKTELRELNCSLKVDVDSVGSLRQGAKQNDPVKRTFASRGFSLIELILVVAILSLLGGAVAGILQGSVTAAVTLTEVSNRQSQVQSFLQLLNTTFRNLGSETLFMAQKNPIVDQSNLFLMFNNSSQLFSWHRNQSKFPAKVLTWWPNDKGVLSIGILEYNRYFKLSSSTENTFSATGWANKIELLGDIKTLSWRFWNQQTKKFSEDWRNPSQRPNGAELTLQLAESTQPSIHFFYIPPIQIQPFILQNNPVTNAPSPTPDQN